VNESVDGLGEGGMAKREALVEQASRDDPTALQDQLGLGAQKPRSDFALLVMGGAAGVAVDRLLGISFFIPSAPFPPKARGRRGFG